MSAIKLYKMGIQAISAAKTIEECNRTKEQAVYLLEDFLREAKMLGYKFDNSYGSSGVFYSVSKDSFKFTSEFEHEIYEAVLLDMKNRGFV